MSELPSHRFTRDQFETVVAGFGDAAAIKRLRSGQQSKWMLTLGTILETVGSERLLPALQLLEQARQRSPEAMAEVITYPHVSIWAWACLETAVGMNTDRSLDDDLLHLNAIAGIAAYRAGITDFSMPVLVREGAVYLPLLGRAMVGPGSHAVLQCRDGKLAVVGDRHIDIPDDPSRDVPGWEGIRQVTITSKGKGMVLSVALDDLDPYRFLYQTPATHEKIGPTPRLSAEEAVMWEDRISEIWDLIVGEYSAYAASLAEVIRVIVPFYDPHTPRSIASEYGFGSIAMTFPGDLQQSTVQILNEVQQQKLNALHDFFPLHYSTTEERFFAPWYDTPRSLSQMFAGVYKAITAITFFDGQRGAADSLESIAAEIDFARWHGRVPFICNMLLQSDDVTPYGHHVIEQAKETFEKQWRQLDVSPEIEQTARMIEVDYRLSWRLRNLQVSADDVTRLVDLWAATYPCPADYTVQTEIIVGHGVTNWAQRRHQRQRVLAGEPDREIPGISMDDDAVARGDIDRATRLYSQAILADPDDREAWAGLALCAWLDPALMSKAPVLATPELACAFFSQVASRRQYLADPVEVLAWLKPMAVDVLHS